MAESAWSGSHCTAQGCLTFFHLANKDFDLIQLHGSVMETSATFFALFSRIQKSTQIAFNSVQTASVSLKLVTKKKDLFQHWRV